MLREHCRVGMKVVCGRPNGEKTVGEVVEIHEKKADVRTLETRGDGNRGSQEHRTKVKPAGTVWWFTFDIIEPLDERVLEALRSLPPKDENLLDYLERGSETLVDDMVHLNNSIEDRLMCGDEQIAILQAILFNYRKRRSIAESIAKFRQKLSAGSYKPEDGQWYVGPMTNLLDEHNRRLGLLFNALGRPVSEAVSFAWADDKRIKEEIGKEFSDITARSKARRHWRKIRDEVFPHDHDHKERVLLWNERRLSPAWIEAGLNEPSAETHRLPAPMPLSALSAAGQTRGAWPTFFEERRQAWKEQNEATRQAATKAQ